MPLTAARPSSSLSNPSLARAGAGRSMGSRRLPLVEQVLVVGAGLGPSATRQRPVWTSSPLPERHSRWQRVSQSAKHLLVPGGFAFAAECDQAGSRRPLAPQQRHWLRSLLQLRVQLQVVQAMQRLGQNVRGLPPAQMARRVDRKAHALVLSSLTYMPSTFRLHHCCCPQGVSVWQPRHVRALQQAGSVPGSHNEHNWLAAAVCMHQWRAHALLAASTCQPASREGSRTHAAGHGMAVGCTHLHHRPAGAHSLLLWTPCSHGSQSRRPQISAPSRSCPELR